MLGSSGEFSMYDTPNNSFNRSANSVAFIENLNLLAFCARTVNPSVGRLSR